ncbi:NUDIX hydrolase [Nonomuraea sp. NPDC049400]|uniref:NUDIX hydrolase n=1 Tax=Nonomuraea sp. NPDC049400 TaxID=3364352 RepID=UPI00378BD176
MPINLRGRRQQNPTSSPELEVFSDLIEPLSKLPERKAVAAVVHQCDRVLLLKRSMTKDLPGIEEIPGEFQDSDEELRQTLSRVLIDHIGWSGPVPVDPEFAFHHGYVEASYSCRVHQITYAVEYGGHPITLSKRHSNFRWILPEDLVACETTRDSLEAIRAWWRACHNPKFRSQMRSGGMGNG